MVEVVARATIW